jgi:hypothetical protein
LDVQQGFLKLIMKSNVSQAMVEVLTLVACENINMIIVNPFTCILWLIDASYSLSHSFSKLLKELVEIVVVHVLCFGEDECCFSLVSFLRTKLCNHLNPHLQFVAMCAQKFIKLDNFPYQATSNSWSNVQVAHGWGQYAWTMKLLLSPLFLWFEKVLEENHVATC